MNNHIPTLLLREWMQHKRGWLIAAFAPPILFLAMLPFGQVKGLPTEYAEQIALAILMISACAVFGICLLIALFQLPGLARRDAQDRSIEFWLSLPGRPSESVAATVLAHAWLAPLGGALVGMLFGLPIAASVLAAKGGMGLAASVSWGNVIVGAAPLLLRGLIGTVPMLLWLAPVIFTLMAASAWFKRLGVPIVLVGGGVAVGVLHKAYDIDWPLQVLGSLNERINHALFHDPGKVAQAMKAAYEQAADVNLWSLAMQDLGQTLAELASMEFLAWTAVAAAGFALVVIKRGRGG